MIDSVSRPRLAKGLSYVLKTSQLVDALKAAGIDCHVDLVYWTPQGGGSILEGHVWDANENVPYRRVYVRAGSVPSASRAAASVTLRDTALPQFIRWLQRIFAPPEGSSASGSSPYFNATYTKDGLAITDRPRYKARRPTR